MIVDSYNSVPDSWGIERRADGAVVVRVPSRRDCPDPLPDAVFTFRSGDPQYSFWEGQLARQQSEES